MESKKHSVFGIISLGLSILSILLFFISMLIMKNTEPYTPSGFNVDIAEVPLSAIIAGVCSLLFMLSAFFALGLGIISLFDKKSKRAFSVIGVIISTFIVIFAISLVILALSAVGY